MAPALKRTLSPHQLADAKRLKAAWKAYQDARREVGERPTQEWLAAETGLGTQGVIWQYLNGNIPLNLKALLKICKAIGSRPSDISPTLTESMPDFVAAQKTLASPKIGTNPNSAADMLQNGARAYNDPSAGSLPTSGDNFEAGPDLRPRKYPEISWVQAGMWTEIADNFVPGDATDWHYCPYDLGAHGFVLRVIGTSMTAQEENAPHSFPAGTLLFVNPDLEPVPGHFVVARRNGNEATFKKLSLIDGELFLEALNPTLPTRYIRIFDEDVICGVVVFSGMPLLTPALSRIRRPG
jgi:SOS-response transcriptional repressor LexA